MRARIPVAKFFYSELKFGPHINRIPELFDLPRLELLLAPNLLPQRRHLALQETLSALRLRRLRARNLIAKLVHSTLKLGPHINRIMELLDLTRLELPLERRLLLQHSELAPRDSHFVMDNGIALLLLLVGRFHLLPQGAPTFQHLLAQRQVELTSLLLELALDDRNLPRAILAPFAPKVTDQMPEHVAHHTMAVLQIPIEPGPPGIRVGGRRVGGRVSRRIRRKLGQKTCVIIVIEDIIIRAIDLGDTSIIVGLEDQAGSIRRRFCEHPRTALRTASRSRW